MEEIPTRGIPSISTHFPLSKTNFYIMVSSCNAPNEQNFMKALSYEQSP